MCKSCKRVTLLPTVTFGLHVSVNKYTWYNLLTNIYLVTRTMRMRYVKVCNE